MYEDGAYTSFCPDQKAKEGREAGQDGTRLYTLSRPVPLPRYAKTGQTGQCPDVSRPVPVQALRRMHNGTRDVPGQMSRSVPVVPVGRSEESLSGTRDTSGQCPALCPGYPARTIFEREDPPHAMHACRLAGFASPWAFIGRPWIAFGRWSGRLRVPGRHFAWLFKVFVR
jgi:hypothetical protein